MRCICTSSFFALLDFKGFEALMLTRMEHSLAHMEHLGGLWNLGLQFRSYETQVNH